MTWTTFPVLIFHLSVIECSMSSVNKTSLGNHSTLFIHHPTFCLLQRLGSADDIHQLFGNGRLAGLVVVECQFLDDLSGVPTGPVHRRHTGTVLRGG